MSHLGTRTFARGDAQLIMDTAAPRLAKTLHHVTLHENTRANMEVSTQEPWHEQYQSAKGWWEKAA